MCQRFGTHETTVPSFDLLNFKMLEEPPNPITLVFPFVFTSAVHIQPRVEEHFCRADTQGLAGISYTLPHLTGTRKHSVFWLKHSVMCFFFFFFINIWCGAQVLENNPIRSHSAIRQTSESFDLGGSDASFLSFFLKVLMLMYVNSCLFLNLSLCIEHAVWHFI